MNNEELLKIISKPWASVSDIKLIAGCGRDNATKIRDTIIRNIKDSGGFLLYSKQIIVPMQMVVELLGIDIDFLKSFQTTETYQRKEL